MKPFYWNFAALAIIPVSAISAPTAQAQLAAIQQAAASPDMPAWRADSLNKLAAKLQAKINRNA